MNPSDSRTAADEPESAHPESVEEALRAAAHHARNAVA